MIFRIAIYFPILSGIVYGVLHDDIDMINLINSKQDKWVAGRTKFT